MESFKFILLLPLFLMSNIITTSQFNDQSKNIKLGGGIQLLMMSEQQKKCERLVNYLIEDFNSMYELLLDENFDRQEVLKLYNQLIKNSELFKIELEDVIISSSDERYKRRYRTKVVSFYSELSILVDSNFSNDLQVKEILSKKYEMLHTLDEIKGIIDNARITTKEEIEARKEKMTAWEWLFGF